MREIGAYCVYRMFVDIPPGMEEQIGNQMETGVLCQGHTWLEYDCLRVYG